VRAVLFNRKFFFFDCGSERRAESVVVTAVIVEGYAFCLEAIVLLAHRACSDT
jgi:hypothetical protein